MYPCVPRLNNRRVLPAITTLCLGSLFCLAAVAADVPDSEELKSQADRWIELERRSADERNAWRTQKEVLTSSVEVLKAERTALQAKIDANDAAAKRFAARLGNTQSEFAAQENAEASLTATCDVLEKRLRALYVRLPDPLKEKLGPLLEKLNKPAQGPQMSIPDRTHALVSALTAIDLFNNTLTLAHHLRPITANQTVDVKVLYWGLAAGYGIDAKGERAWMLTPGATGWQWTEAPGQLGDIAALIQVYEKGRNPELIALPIAAERGTP